MRITRIKQQHNKRLLLPGAYVQKEVARLCAWRDRATFGLIIARGEVARSRSANR